MAAAYEPRQVYILDYGMPNANTSRCGKECEDKMSEITKAHEEIVEIALYTVKFT